MDNNFTSGTHLQTVPEAVMKGRESGMPDERTWGAFFNPRCILERLDCGIAKGDVIEFGCGYGTFTISAAGLINGRVYALDIEPGLIAELQAKTRQDCVENVVAEVRDFVRDGSGRPDSSVAYAMLFNILHIEDPVALLREAYRALIPGGTAAVIHWRTDIPTPRGPSPAIRPQPLACQAWAETAGFRFVRNEALCCCSWHWGIVLNKPDPSRPHPQPGPTNAAAACSVS